MRILKKSILLSALIMPVLAIAQTGNYKLTVNLKKKNSEAWVYLIKHPTIEQEFMLDSAAFPNGRAEFNFKFDEPAKVTMLVKYKPTDKVNLSMGDDFRTFYLEKGAVTITGVDSLITAKIKGGPVNNDYQKFSAQLKSKVFESFNPRFSVFVNTPKEKQDDAFNAALYALIQESGKFINSLKLAYIKANPDKFINLDLMADITLRDYESTANADLFMQLSPKIKNTPSGKKITEIIERQIPFSIGAIAPEFTQNDINDKPVTLSNFRGKYVLIDFWASWCGPCRAENPVLVKAYENYKDKNFTVLGISLDNPGKKDDWLAAIKKDGLTWTQVSDLKGWKNEVAVQYQVKSVPHNILIDPDGKIVAKNLRGNDLDTYLKKYLN